MSRRLVAADRPDALTAFKTARHWFIAGRKIEMQDLASELGVNRATLFRWVGNRDELLAEVIWSLAEPTFAAATRTAKGRGGRKVAATLSSFAIAVDAAEFFRSFVQREPERALRILTTRAGVVQGRLIATVERLLSEEAERGGLRQPLPIHELAYLLVRIAESFVYTDIITGEAPAVAKVEQAVAALLAS